MPSRIEDLLRRRSETQRVSEERARTLHEQGKLTVIERLNLLLDPDSLIPIGRYVLHRATGFGMELRKAYGDGVIAGLGSVNGRRVAVYAQDFTFMGGSVGEMHAYKIARTIETAVKLGIPVIGLNDSGGARIQEGVDSLKGYGDIFYRNVMASGVVPQIVAILGPCAGGAVYSPALADFIIMTRKSYMFITGPKVVKASIGEDISTEELGGAEVHASKSGVAHFVVEDDREAVNLIKKLISYLPSNNAEDPPFLETKDSPYREDPTLDSIVPEDPAKPYDVREIIGRVFDYESFLEVHANFAQNAVVGFARLGGHGVCVVANQPAVMAGSLDIDSSDKISRFVTFCDSFNFPIITFVDVPGFLPGSFQEHHGVIRHGAKIIYAYADATVPKITVILRKAYGGAYIAMGSKHLGADFVLAWPTAEIAVMGPEGAIEIIYKKELESAENPEELAKTFVEKYRNEIANPYVPASRGYVDDVIIPRETRAYLYKLLTFLMDKREKQPRPPRKHGVPPV
ncbi:methylmalonyl-CoA carboxyltransferase [Infirmifilum uzonense]|uniref:Methylmalonyl-CoA carboxyltransferase n=1 Tax=Infirmifilum uzonense TaxID=1550241 RepID=A0A0F7FG84_9CREN|nr:acyl-CoA carboxylase subunit beta [Infirmifilum uzonense]AKG38098.1 methylmalonyl-CoA carboxyltransferase [Infirmifilum uzonense]